MKVINKHHRIINQSKDKVDKLIITLATKEDKVWPQNKWPAMRFDNGIKVGSKGGHGIIRYWIEEYDQDRYIKFRFTKPRGFVGFHDFQINKITDKSTEVIHTIQMKTKGLDTLSWFFVIRWLHDALIEDAFDNIENKFLYNNKITKWSLWVRFWRYIFSRISN